MWGLAGGRGEEGSRVERKCRRGKNGRCIVERKDWLILRRLMSYIYIYIYI